MFSSRINIISFLLLCTVVLWAQGSADPVVNKPTIDLRQGVSFEVTPHTGAMGSSGVFGLKAGMNYGALNLEASLAQVIGKTANLYPLMVNFGLNLSTSGKLLPYGVVGGGLFLTVPTNAIGSKTVSTVGVNFGGGARLYVTPRFGFRLEVKQYITTVNDHIADNSNLLIFQEVAVGVSFMFR